ncbi:hypothetical protein [Leptothrix discophora]|uniref:Uncharacterized protein n=1 Tax=Leptothrix discophora TaxID=89 RepID=A0ABT9G662_LEPDI|nr:hypothetical protein [Leptothrix discophora]MDP4301972.1 hypothetical protein [Leptothrix discophora]
MALEYIDFVLPIALIRQKDPGGWTQCLQDHERLIGCVLGSMNTCCGMEP